MLLKKVPFGISNKTQFVSFSENVQKQKNWIPGPKYNMDVDWSKTLPKQAGVFLKDTRHTISGDIIDKAKKYGPTPGPGKYLED